MATPRKKQAPKVGVDSVKGSNTTPILLASGAAILLLLIVALVIAQPWKSSSSSTADNVLEFQPVTVVGNALPAEYSDSAGTQLNVAAGTTAPELQGKAFDGTPIDIKADGKPKVVIFFAHWCPHCQREVPLLSPWLKANMAKYPKVEFYGVATASSPDRPNYPPSAWLSKVNWPTPVIADNNTSDAANAFGLGAYPYMLALNSKNQIITRTSGELSISDFQTKIVAAAQAS